MGELDVVFKLSCFLSFLPTPPRPDPDGQRHDFCDNESVHKLDKLLFLSIKSLIEDMFRQNALQALKFKVSS